jgi:peptidylamidoglycolate lyase
MTRSIVVLGVLVWLIGVQPSPRYHVVHGWPLLPEGRSLDIVAGVGVDSRGDVFVFHRGGRKWPESDTLDTAPIAEPTVVVLDGRTGRQIAQWGANAFAMPHGLSIDRHDHVWLTDVALNQVFEFSHDGRLLRTLGVRGVAGDDSAHFNRPTKVAFASDGSIYVSDGYRNSRVVKFSREGKFELQWGTKGSGAGQFDLPHGIAVDARGRVYVADRNNARVEIFDAGGRFLSEWKGASYGRAFDVAVGPDGNVFIADGGDIPAAEPDRSSVVVVRPDGAVIERFGRYGFYDGELFRAHDLAVGKDGSVYVGGADGRVQKFVR